MTHQATANRWSLSSHMVPVVARFCFCDGRMDGRTDGRTGGRISCVKIMTTYSAVAWRVNIKKEAFTAALKIRTPLNLAPGARAPPCPHLDTPLDQLSRSDEEN